MRLFDAYFVIDWSARSKPSGVRPRKDALWIGEGLMTDEVGTVSLKDTYWPTRKACTDYLRSRLLHHAHAHHRILVGFDFAYGYPAGYAAALGLRGDSPACTAGGG